MKDFPIYFTFDRNYVLGACVAFHSLLKNISKEYKCHMYVLHTKLLESDCQKMKRVVDRFSNATISFINVSTYEEQLARISPKGHFSKEIFYKLVAAEVFPQYDRIVCSDVDVVFKDDLTSILSLYQEDDFYFAGVGPIENSRMDVYKKKFSDDEIRILEHEIAAGLLFMNLKKIREDNIQQRLLDYYLKNYNRFFLPEQDCIILTCWPDIKYLPMKYVVPNTFYSLDMNGREFYQGNTQFAGDNAIALKKFNDALDNPIQLHYVGFNKPWNSLFVAKQRHWMAEMVDSKCLWLYISEIPYNFIVLRIKRYNVSRFLKKLKNRLWV